MAQYRFITATFGGTGSVTVNGVAPSAFYEEGTSLSVAVTPDSGFFFDSFNFNNGFLTSGSNPYVFNMPSRDIKGKVNLTGTLAPIDGYGLKYFNEFCDEVGQNIRIEILQDGYPGSSSQVITQFVRYNLGNFGQDTLDPIVRSYLDFALVGDRDEFLELLDGGYRNWQVKMYINTNIFWTGYINNNVLTLNEVGTRQAQRFTASDGINAFESQRVIDQYFAGFVAGTAMGAMFASLNQTFDELRPVNMACDIYETRLDDTDSLFSQILIPANAIYTDGEIPLYYGSGEVAVNTSVYLSEFIESMLLPFLCRVFLWKNEFYIISSPELAKDSYRLFKYDNAGDFDEQVVISDSFDLSCKFTNGQRTARTVFTEFTSVLKLGVLDYSARGGFYEEPFSIDSWFVNSASSPYVGIYQLRKWNYVNAVPSNRPSSFPSSTNPARIQYATDTVGDRCKIWGTTTVDGISDTNLSYIELDSTRTGQDIPILQELANTISIAYEFMFESRDGSDPVRTNTAQGIQIQIGDSYLEWDGDQTFTWTLTPTIILFPQVNMATWNKVEIIDVTVPEDGNLFIRLYETITNNAASVNRYTVAYRDLEVKIEENDAFVTEEIGFKFITDDRYSAVYPQVDLKIGDVPTSNSSSAIKLDLIGYPASELWSRDGVEELPLMQIFLQELGNLKGKQNPRVIATVLRNEVNPIELKPYEKVIYDGGIWMIMALELNFASNDWRVEIARIADLPS